MASAREFRAAFQRFLPFRLYRRRRMKFPATNGKWVPGSAAIDVTGPKEGRRLYVCTKQCCVYHLCADVVHEGLHVFDVLERELDADPKMAERAMGRNSPGREAAFALLSSVLEIPTYCESAR